MLKNKKWLNLDNENMILSDYKVIRDDIFEEYIDIFNLKDEKGVPLPLNKDSGDYIFINNLSLAIWNMGNMITNLYDQHNLDLAQGNYLDRVMALYGNFRQEESPYILEVELTGTDHLLFSPEMELFDIEKPEYKFIYFKEVSKGVDSSRYLVIGKTYYLSLIYSRINSLNLVSPTHNIQRKEGSPIKVLNIQREKESDDKFKSRVSRNWTTTNDLMNQIRGLGYVNDITILGLGQYPLGWSKATYSPGDFSIIVNFNNLFYNEPETSRELIIKDISNMIYEGSPIGTNSIYGEYRLGGGTISNHTVPLPLNNLLQGEVKFSSVQYSPGVLVFEYLDINPNLFLENIQLLLNDLNIKPMFYNYEYYDMIETIQKYFNIRGEIYFSQGQNNSNPLSIGSFADISNPTTLKMEQTSLTEGASKISISPVLLKSINLTKATFKNYFNRYKIYVKEGGMMVMVIYGGDIIEEMRGEGGRIKETTLMS